MSARSVTAEELVRALERNNATLPAEIGTFIVFEGCESMLDAGPRELEGLAHLRISDTGSITLSGASCDDETAARGLHRSLSKLLSAAGPSLPPALLRLAEAGPRGAEFSLRALHDELEAALVPLNRTASRRVLSRFAREAAQPIEEVDDALNKFIGKGSAPDNDAQKPMAKNELPAASLDRGGEESHYIEAAARADRISEEQIRVPRPSRPSRISSPPPAPRPSYGGRDSLRGLRTLPSDAPESSSGASKLFLGFALIALAIIGVSLAFSVRKEREANSSVAEPQLSLEPQVAPARAGDLTVHVSQPNAQVLRFLGRAPVTVPNLPVGVAHEFVATAEGHRPSRVLVPANADWEATAEGARYEAALQLTALDGSERKARDPSLDLGPSKLDAQAGLQPSRLGSVRVVVTPHGARVYQLIGFSPDVKVTDLPLAEPQELLVYREGYAPVVRVVSEPDFKPVGGRLAATLDVQLSKDSAR